jgi:hypothetical protein
LIKSIAASGIRSQQIEGSEVCTACVTIYTTLTVRLLHSRFH